MKQQFSNLSKIIFFMSKNYQTPQKVLNLVKDLKIALKKSVPNYERKRSYKSSTLSSSKYYEEAKKAQTEQRNLWRALNLYIKAIQNEEKKDSTIKDFASSLHQLGYTKQAVRLMDQCQFYYDGNKDKYFRLRDNLQQQIRPTGKHECRYILIQNINSEVNLPLQEEALKSSLFKCPKRIKGVKYLKNFDLMKESCSKELTKNILLQFESFSAAKKTLEGFYFDQWFASHLYWVNSNSMKIVCSALDGKQDFQEGLIIDQELIHDEIKNLKSKFWSIFGEQIYQDKKNNGFINLLSTHIIKEYLFELQRQTDDKENIFEISKIRDLSLKSNNSFYVEQNAFQIRSSLNEFHYQNQYFYQDRRCQNFNNMNYY